ncbi:hypothetical protein YC2023_117637 [Brassica napus]
MFCGFGRLFLVSNLSFGFYVVGFHSPSLSILLFLCDAGDLGSETFVPWTLLERAGVQRHTVLATLRIIYPYEEMWGVSLMSSWISGRFGVFGIIRGSVPALTRDSDLWDSDFSGFQCLLGIGNFKIKSLVNFPVGFPGELPAGFLDELPADFSSKFVASLLLVTEIYFRKESFHFRKGSILGKVSILGNFIFGESEPKSLIVVLQLTSVDSIFRCLFPASG